MSDITTIIGLASVAIVTGGGIVTTYLKQRNFIRTSDGRHIEKMAMQKEQAEVIREFVNGLQRVENKADALIAEHAKPDSMFSTYGLEDRLKSIEGKVDKIQGRTLVMVNRGQQYRDSDS